MLTKLAVRFKTCLGKSTIWNFLRFTLHAPFLLPERVTLVSLSSPSTLPSRLINTWKGFSPGDSIQQNLTQAEDVAENRGRLITLEFEDLYVINVYQPNSGSGLDDFVIAWITGIKDESYIVFLSRKRRWQTCGPDW